MKKILIFILLSVFLFIGVSTLSAQTFYPANQKTLAWDAVTTLDNDEVIPEGNIIKYRVYYAAYNEVTDGPEEPQEVGLTEDTQFTITLSDEGRYLFGVRSERYLSSDDAESVSISEISWSNIDYQTEPFGVVFFYPLKGPKNLR